jgi:hypothetical protein
MAFDPFESVIAVRHRPESIHKRDQGEQRVEWIVGQPSNTHALIQIYSQITFHNM